MNKKIPSKIVVPSYVSTTLLFYLVWTLYSVAYTISASELSAKINIGSYNKLVQYIVVAGLFVGLVLQKKTTIKRAVALTMFAGLVILMEIAEKDMTFLVYAMFIMVAQKINLYQFVAYDFKLKITLFLIVVSLCFLGITDNYTALINEKMKMSFGFGHPNVFCFYIFTILMEWMILRFKKIRAAEWIVIICVYIVAYLLGAARTSSYTFIFVYFLMLTEKYAPKLLRLRIYRLLVSSSTALMASLSFLCVHYFNKHDKFMIALNQIVTGRLFLASEFLKKYNLGLFGQQIETVGTREASMTGHQSMILDNAYVRCALVYGLLFLCIFCLINAYLSATFFRNQHPELALFILFFAVIGFGEAYTLNIFYNVLMLFFLNTTFQKPIRLISIQELKENVFWHLKRRPDF